jgi:hypothetical protein
MSTITSITRLQLNTLIGLALVEQMHTSCSATEDLIAHLLERPGQTTCDSIVWDGDDWLVDDGCMELDDEGAAEFLAELCKYLDDEAALAFARMGALLTLLNVERVNEGCFSFLSADFSLAQLVTQ